MSDLSRPLFLSDAELIARNLVNDAEALQTLSDAVQATAGEFTQTAADARYLPLHGTADAATTATTADAASEATGALASNIGTTGQGLIRSKDFLFTEVATAAKTDTFAITGADTGGGYFLVAGQKAADFPNGVGFSVGGSTGNDGDYTVSGTGELDDEGSTRIFVNENVADATADGTITRVAGVYTATLPISAGSTLLDVTTFLFAAPWAADVAGLSVGDSFRSKGYIGGGGGDLVALTDADDIATNTPAGDASARPCWLKDSGDYSSAFHDCGIPYDSDDTLTLKIVTQIGSPPATPSGIIKVRVSYSTPQTATNATAVVA